MNPVVKILNGVIIKINSILDSIDLRTQETIKRAFFFLIFILCLVGISIGYNMGVDSAKIKSKPIAENINDTFKHDISREKKTGDFTGVLESVVQKDMSLKPRDKYHQSMKSEEQPENENNTILDKEPDNRSSETFESNDSVIDPKTGKDDSNTFVTPLKKRSTAPKNNIIINSKVEKLNPEDKRKTENIPVYKNDNGIMR